MADSNAVELARIGDAMVAKKTPLDSLWQRLAEEFYQARASFTNELIDGDEYMVDQYESVPAQNRRDLAYAMGALTRPKSQQWFDFKAQDESRNTEAAKFWFSKAKDKQRTLLYNRTANFQRSMQTSDNDFVAFGNAVISHTESPERNGLVVYNTHHLKLCAWNEDRFRQVNVLHRMFKLKLSGWKSIFPDAVMPSRHAEVLKKDPHAEIDVRHAAFPIGDYDFYKTKARNKAHKFASVYYDPSEHLILKEGGYVEFPYTVRRWILLDDSPYAHSPAAMYGIIDSRLLQSQSRVILEAGERVIDPPLVARAEGVLGTVNNYPGYVNWIDASYDERQGEALRALKTEANIPLGLEMKQDTRQILAAAFFLNKLNLPSERDMTAFEVNERIAEYIRSIGPVVEPFEADNAMLLDSSFNMNLRLGNFGPPEFVPPELNGAEVVFEFDGPLQMAYKRLKLGKAKEVAANAGELARVTGKPEVLDNYDFDKIARDATEFVGGNPEWLMPMDKVMARRQGQMQAQEQMKQQQESATMMQGLHAAADLAPKLAAANQSIPAIVGGDDGGSGPVDPYPQDEAADAQAA